MNRRTTIALLVLAGAGFGYYWFSKRNQKDQAPPEDQGPAQAAEQYYAPPPLFAAEPMRNTDVFVNQKQAMPLPYNT